MIGPVVAGSAPGSSRPVAADCPGSAPEDGIDHRGAVRKPAAILVHIGLGARPLEQLALDPQQLFQKQRPPRFVHLGQEVLDPRLRSLLPCCSKRSAAVSIQVQSDVGVSFMARFYSPDGIGGRRETKVSGNAARRRIASAGQRT